MPCHHHHSVFNRIQNYHDNENGRTVRSGMKMLAHVQYAANKQHKNRDAGVSSSSCGGEGETPVDMWQALEMCPVLNCSSGSPSPLWCSRGSSPGAPASSNIISTGASQYGSSHWTRTCTRRCRRRCALLSTLPRGVGRGVLQRTWKARTAKCLIL